MGYAFTIPLFRYFGGCITGCYVHYPTISSDMLERVVQRHTDYNNASRVSQSATLSYFKLIYYQMFAWAYGVAGRRCDLILVNSSWTQGHILDLWRAADRTFIVYPPCDVDEFLSLPLSDRQSSSIHTVVSIGQFRPEKDHRLQLKAFQKFLEMIPMDQRSHFRLVLVGGCRNEDDAKRVSALKDFASELGIFDRVEFRLNVTFDELKQSLLEADIGLHTMWNEHFGIGVVECMAAGTIVLAHNSGGPKLDIVVDHKGQKTGFLASDVDSYATALSMIFKLDADKLTSIRVNARESIWRFSDTEFEQQFLMLTESLFLAPV
jgi:alpha-1,2-mannosyltransferase